MPKNNRLILTIALMTVYVILKVHQTSHSNDGSIEVYPVRLTNGVDPSTIIQKHRNNQPQVRISGQNQDIERKSTRLKADVTISPPEGLPKQYNYVALINTPKCGTGGLTEYFYRSFQCDPTNSLLTPIDDSVSEVGITGCPNGNVIQRGHYIEKSTLALENNLSLIQDDKCLVVSVIRDPMTWLPSLFMEKNDLCEAAKLKKHKPRHTLKLYREFLKLDHNYFYFRAIPFLLLEFGAKSLTDEMKKIQLNGGFSLLHHPLKIRRNFQSNAPDDKITTSPFSTCDFLFLQLEYHDNWREIFDKIMLVPENKSKIFYHQPSSGREQICPALKDHYDKIRNYKLNEKEKANIIHQVPYMAEWFRVYGH